eukprot:TRINITY_DN13596_c0_g1_i1.p1 TRINITY_DN13596_c0_g1~~TRINITY_DN13596_c0_g1_i1.p1  ORF type:complete len:556 (-),score=124.38 TRINITY_DN13596_c0_g1_i1:62-1615(-)
MAENNDRFWEEKPNAGYSGTPLWKLHAQSAALAQADAASSVKVPNGFVRKEGDWYWSDQRKYFWNLSDGKFYIWDPVLKVRAELYEAVTYETTVQVGGMCHERAQQVKHVIVRDLGKAAQALRMSIEHVDRPAALYALYEGHRATSSSNTCADFCAKHLHGKLLPKLASYRGFWDDARLETAMRESFEELDASYAEKHPGSSEGCSAAVALLLGNRLVVASAGDISCVLCLRSGETERIVQAHAVPDPDADEDEDDETEDTGAAGGAGEAAAEAEDRPLRWTRSLGDLDYKGPSSSIRLSPTPEVKILHLEHKHHGFAFICRALYQSIGGSPAVTTVFRRSAGRPRFASGALVDAAVQWLGQVGPDCGLASVVAFFEKTGARGEAPAKRPRTSPAELSQVRLRTILVKHRECKSTIDKVRNRQVKRTRGEAERLLRRILEECASDADRKIFTQRCRELSECQSCLKAGELAGDLGWQRRGQGKFGETFESAAFALQIGELSDLVDSDHGVHVLLRTA